MAEEIKSNKSMKFDKIQIKLASPENILEWSHGEVTNPETINYRTLKPEKDGLFCERIFGPSKDWECHCGKYKKIKDKGIVCDKCGVEVTKASVRRDRMGHIHLAAPVSHIWYFKGIPSRMDLILDIGPKNLEKVLYFASYIVIDPGETDIPFKKILSETEYRELCEQYGSKAFRVGMGAEAILELLQMVNLEEEEVRLKEELANTTSQKAARLIKRIEVVEAFKNAGTDYLIAIGGGSSMDTAKAIGIIINNPEFADVRSLEGVADTKKPAVPIIAVPTTAGTAAEVTINYVITDAEKNRKMVCVDPHDIPVVAVVDPDMMSSMPKGLTAATGMDALTHAMEAVVANGAIDVTDATALYAIKQIFEYLPRAVENGQDIEAREQMCYACFLNGIAFSNAGLGNVHAMAHQLGGLYDLPHGVCNAMLLPIVEEENAKQAPAKFRVMAETIGMDVEGKTDEECMDFVIGKIKELSERVGIPKTLSELGVENPDFETLAENSMKDACAGANPVFFDKELLIKLFKKIA